MNPKHESILQSITGEHPAQVEEMAKYESIKAPVSKEFLESLTQGDEGLRELYEEMIEYFYRYTKDVCIQESLKQEKDGLDKNLEEIRALDVQRSALHNAMIDSVKIFARNVANKGGDVSWFPDIDKKGRAGYAQLALLITFVDILNHNQAE